jgi:dTDP-4-dehydrorhamnose 3,5-epimerase
VKFSETELPGVLLFEPRKFGDDRGFFVETWNHGRYSEAGLSEQFVQSNASRSQGGVLRGLHFQNPNPQGKLVYVLDGTVFDVAVDLRRDSPNFGRWYGEYLSADNCRQLYLPPGFAHGFCVTSETALFCYLCTTHYDAAADSVVRWDDPRIGIEWPVDNPVLSAKDAAAPLLDEIDPDRLP